MSRPGPAEDGTQVLRADTPRLFKAGVARAAELLRAGEVVALPTETVYGLAANALDPAAVEKIFRIKGRPAHNPIIVHVASIEMARRCVTKWPKIADKLARSFWPGPLTLVLPRSGCIPAIVAAGGSTVGVRWPSHPLIQAVIRACGFPLAAPSANPSNRLSPTTAQHVHRGLGGRIRLIIDGGPSQVGIESTVLDLSVRPPRVLRPGIISEEGLMAVAGRLGDERRAGGRILKSPGQLARHYSPRARLVVKTWQSEEDLRQQISRLRAVRRKTAVLAHTRVPSGAGLLSVCVLPHDPAAFARALYGELHACDDAGATLIVVEALPRDLEWRGLNDRLNRAAAG